MKRRIFLYGVLCTILSCTSNYYYYEKPIKLWFDKNLNDISSYEPVEYLIIDSINNNKISRNLESKYGQFENVIQRKADLINSIINLIRDSTLKKNLKECNLEVNKKINRGGVYNLQIIVELNDSIDKILQKVEIPIEEKAMLEGMSRRIESERNGLESELISLGIDMNNLLKEINNGQYIYHKYRAKNGFGAIVLSETIFKLNSNKNNVEKILKIY